MGNTHNRSVMAIAIAVGIVSTAACHGHAAAKPTSGTRYTIDTPIGDLVKNPRAKAIIDKYAAGIASGPHYFMTARYSLRELQPMVHGVITESELRQMALELSQIR